MVSGLLARLVHFGDHRWRALVSPAHFLVEHLEIRGSQLDSLELERTAHFGSEVIVVFKEFIAEHLKQHLSGIHQPLISLPGAGIKEFFAFLFWQRALWCVLIVIGVIVITAPTIQE